MLELCQIRRRREAPLKWESPPSRPVRARRTASVSTATNASPRFCFFHPRVTCENRIDRLLRHWGGEALYNSVFLRLMSFEQLQIYSVSHGLVTRVVRVQMIAGVIRRQ